MYSKIWYLEQDITLTAYHSKIGPSNDSFIRAVTSSILHNLWNPRLYHAAKVVTINIDKLFDGIPSLRKIKPFFS